MYQPKIGEDYYFIEDGHIRRQTYGSAEDAGRYPYKTLAKAQAQLCQHLLQQLEDEQGIVFSDGHFRKLRRGMIGVDDWIEEEARVKLLDIRGEVEAVFDKYLGHESEGT